MTRRRHVAVALLAALPCICGAACQLKRPDVPPSRMIEPLLIEPTQPATSTTTPPSPGADPIAIRLLETQARGNIGRRLLHQQPDGELVEDVVWFWSITPDHYLDSALRLALSSRRDVRLVDSGNAATMAVTLATWQLESTNSTQLVGVVEVVVTRPDRSVRTQLVRKSEPVSGELPGDLAAASGRLLQALASESVTRAIQAATLNPRGLQVTPDS